MNQFTMKAYKYDGKIHYQSPFKLVHMDKNHCILYGESQRVLTHYTRNKEFTFENQSIEFFFTDRWYTVACVIDLEGKIVFYYCNIAKPCTITNNEVHFIDMDLDVIIKPDMSYEIVDRDEFEENQISYGYGSVLVNQVEDGLNQILYDIENRNYPFDGTIEKLINELNLRKL